MDKRKEELLDALYRWVSQRPGLEFANYGDWSSYRSEMRSITKDLHDARALLTAVQWRDSITADAIIEASKRSFSGRLEIEELAGGFSIQYCTGQYFPTEYRRAVCAVLSSVLWSYWRENSPADVENRGNYIQFMAKREVGRSIASRWFH